MEKKAEMKTNTESRAGHKRRKEERPRPGPESDASKHHRQSQSTKRKHTNTNKCLPDCVDSDSDTTDSASTSKFEKSQRKAKLRSSPQKEQNASPKRAIRAMAKELKESTSTIKPPSKFRIPKVKSTAQAQPQPKKEVIVDSKRERTGRTSKQRKSDEKATLVNTTHFLEPARKKPLMTDKSWSKNMPPKVNILEEKLKAEMIAIPKQSRAKHDGIPNLTRESMSEGRKGRLTTTFPTVKENQNLPNRLGTSMADRNIAKMFAPVGVQVKTLFQPSDNNDETNETMDMDWDNQVPEIRRLWDEHSVLPCIENNEDDMEVDPSDILIIVPDTNIWIGCVNLLKQLLNTDFPKVGYPTIVIPWMVLQELDVQTKAPSSKSPRYSVKFIHELLSSKHPRVRGQRASDASLSQMKFDELVADDSILQCAFQLQRADTTVIFLSNDRNLCNKALVHGLITYDSEDVVSKITNVLTSDSPNVPADINNIQTAHTNGKQINNYSTCNWTQGYRQPNESFTSSSIDFTSKYFGETSSNKSITTTITSDPIRQNLPIITNSNNQADVFKLVMDSLRGTISYIIETKMKEDYGDSWKHTVKVKPPWTLLSGVQCMVAHWIAVFSFVFGSKGQSCAEELLNLVKTYKKTGGDQETEINIVECAIGLFTLGKSSVILQSPHVINCRQMLLSFVASKK